MTFFKHKSYYLKDGATILALEWLKDLVTTPRSLLFCREQERQFSRTEAFRAAMLDLVRKRERPGDK